MEVYRLQSILVAHEQITSTFLWLRLYMILLHPFFFSPLANFSALSIYLYFN